MFVLDYGLDRDWTELGADNLVKLLIMQLYFPEFARLLQGAAQRDPISEFLEYVSVRALLRQRVNRDSEGWPQVVALLQSYKVVPDADTPPLEILGLLEQELPEPYPVAAQDQNFVALLHTFSAEEDRARIWEKLQGRYVSALGPVDVAASTPEGLGTGDRLRGLRVLWCSRTPEADRQWVGALERNGATVVVRRFEDAIRDTTLSTEALDSLVASMGSDDAEFDDVERLREVVPYRGPVILFTSRVTPARREAAARLKAPITNDAAELLSLLAGAKGAPRGPRISLHYRRDDASGYAGRLYDRLVAEFGDQVFRDIDSIAPGVDLMAAIEEAQRSADVHLVVIGPSWASSVDREGRRRIDRPDDILHREQALALQSGRPVIPVLVGGALMPRGEELPEDVRRIADRNAVELSDERWEYDIGRLLSALRSISGVNTPAPA